MKGIAWEEINLFYVSLEVKLRNWMDLEAKKGRKRIDLYLRGTKWHYTWSPSHPIVTKSNGELKDWTFLDLNPTMRI